MLNYLDTFCAVVDSGSLNAAAARLHITQPAITKQMHALEDELGVQLLVRGPRGVTPTQAGRQIHRLARRVVAAFDGCRRIADEWRDSGPGQLVVASGLTLTLFTLPPVIKEYSARAPGVRLRVATANSAEALARVLDFSADVALVTTYSGHPEISAVPLFTDPLVVVAREPAEGLPETIAGLAGRTLISFRGSSGLRQYVDQVLDTRAVRVDAQMEFDSIEAIKTMVSLGLGVALLPLSAVRDDAAAGRLCARRLNDWPDAGRAVTLIRRRAGLRTGAVNQFTAVARRLLALPRGEQETAAPPGAAARVGTSPT